MEAKNRRTDPPLVEALFEEPYRFGFFQAVRLLERLFPERQPVGRSQQPDGRASRPAREVVRFRTPPTLDFPPSEVRQFAHDGDGEKPPQMTVAFMGLTGPSGVLPNPYTELLMDRVRAGDRAMHEFLDLFSHRMISLFYRAWEKYRFAIAYEREGEDRTTEYFFDLIGLGARGLRGRLGLPDQGLLCYAGLIAQRPHSAVAIAAILSDYFGVPACAEQFRGRWLRLDGESVTRLGRANSRLGQSAIAGARVWDNQSKFRLRFGPLKFAEFTALLPVGSAFKPATQLARFLAGMELDFDVQLVLKAEEAPGTTLVTREGRRPMLGWTTWLKTRPMARDDDQVVLSATS